MSKVAPPIAANQTGDGIITSVVRRKCCIYTLLLGATAGMLVGILNLLAVIHRWKFEHCFDVPDSPMYSLFSTQGYYSVAGTFVFGPDIGPYFQLAIICYWTVIGLFLTSLLLLVRAGVFGEIARDRKCRYTLFIGLSSGMFIGILKFLAASNGWEKLERHFDDFDWPFEESIRVLNDRVHFLAFVPGDPRTEFICWHAVDAAFWGIVGLFLALIFCVVRTLRKGIATTGTQVAEE